MKIKFLKPKKKFKKQDFAIYPSLYWKILLSVSFFIILVSFLFSYLLFLKVSKDIEISVDELDLQVPSIRHERIDGVKKYFEERELKTIEILNSPEIVVDPSL